MVITRALKLSVLGATLQLSACGSLTGSVSESSLPTCTELRSAFRAATGTFESIRSRLRIESASSSIGRYSTSLKMSGATSCEVADKSSGWVYECEWAGDGGRALMGAYYRGIRDKLKACIAEGEVTQADSSGYTSVKVRRADGSMVDFTIWAMYESSPHYSYLTVQFR
jgi:hypothetical protein